jgi:hypothetical protein
MKMYLEPSDYKIANNNGISNKLANQRFYEYGWTAKNTITKPPERDLSKWIKIAEENGISRMTFYNRVSKRQNWDYERAATTPVKKLA